ncbi:hypothetical protein GSI_14518 [Ganoderma sinense ZZ0214-1]|uniref:Uncharacterized protein n=1 Tax=Ganoderma sinense ZZ0214-1 TaxID=1077348 RepID=A0A2G8RNX4_9APHY|nr:hypothetical protein GSI_14518 [Ganoderma sinense ZZ0214-1]
MPLTSRCYALLASGRQKCALEAPPTKGLCQEHYDEYLSLKSAYEQATKEAEALEILLADIASKKMNEKGGGDPDELRADGIIVAKYIERLQSAIRGRKEVEERFPLQLAAVMSAGRGGRDNVGQLARCEAKLAHVGTSERCGVYVLSSNRFCAGHYEEFKALKTKLDVCAETTAEYRDRVRWGLQHRAGRDPGVELSRFPIDDEQLLATTEKYCVLLQEEVDLRRKYSKWFPYFLGLESKQENWEVKEENDRLESKCLDRLTKAPLLRLKIMLCRAWFAEMLLGLFGAGPSENDVV